VIRWITENLGTAPATDPAISAEMSVIDVRDLVDKSGNTAVATREKIEQGVLLLREGRRVIVCCDYGISRSNSIAAGLLARQRGIPFDQAVREVMQATGESEIKLEPLRAVRQALGEVAAAAGEEPRVLVTGGSGFVGQALLDKLGECCFVLAPPRAQVDLLAGALDLDLLVKEHGINCLLHLAAPRVYTSNHAMGEMVTLLRNALDVCRENRLRLVYPSTWEVYSGYRTSTLLADESLPLYAKGPYGEAKLFCEQMIENQQKRYDLSFAMLRSCPIYGEGCDRPKFIYNFIDKARKGLPITTHSYLNGEPKLDLLHIDDFASAMIAAVTSGFTGTVNIGSGRATGTREVAEWIVSQTGSRSVVDSRTIEDFAANITMDISKAKSLLGWQPHLKWEVGMSRLLAR